MYEDCPSYKLFYTYDANGFLSGIKKVLSNGTIENYAVLCNMFGDVIGIYNSSKSLVAKYTYDTWGNLLSITNASGADISSTDGIWTQNSIRYRGYVYDSETKLYYLQSRYYDPETCRFINVDNAISGIGGSLQGYNLFAYCMNNPVNMDDADGNWPEWLKEAGNRIVHTVKFIAKTVIAPLKAITVELGWGVGFGAKFDVKIAGVPIELGAMNTSTDSISYSNNKFDMRNTTSSRLSMNISGVIDVSENQGVSHSYFDNNCTCNIFKSSPSEKKHCAANQSIIESNAMFGLSLGAYAFLGGELTIGIDFKAFNDELISIFNETLSYGN